jgi:hypothetical protein
MMSNSGGMGERLMDVGAKCVTVIADASSGEVVRAISDADYTAVIRAG